MKKEELKSQARYVVGKLKALYPDAHCELYHETPAELLVATLLSAQCTDKRVNMVTSVFFKKYKLPEEVADLDVKIIEAEVKSTGFYRNKAKNIKALCQKLLSEYEGVVPNSLEELIEFPGVGRKTANVVLGEIFNNPAGVVVDTHVRRLSNRLGLTKSQNPVIIERELAEIIPRKNWVKFSHWMIFHGRITCKAIKPRCSDCAMKRKCYYFVNKEKR